MTSTGVVRGKPLLESDNSSSHTPSFSVQPGSLEDLRRTLDIITSVDERLLSFLTSFHHRLDLLFRHDFRHLPRTVHELKRSCKELVRADLVSGNSDLEEKTSLFDPVLTELAAIEKKLEELSRLYVFDRPSSRDNLMKLVFDEDVLVLYAYAETHLPQLLVSGGNDDPSLQKQKKSLLSEFSSRFKLAESLSGAPVSSSIETFFVLLKDHWAKQAGNITRSIEAIRNLTQTLGAHQVHSCDRDFDALETNIWALWKQISEDEKTFYVPFEKVLSHARRYEEDLLVQLKKTGERIELAKRSLKVLGEDRTRALFKGEPVEDPRGESDQLHPFLRRVETLFGKYKGKDDLTRLSKRKEFKEYFDEVREAHRANLRSYKGNPQEAQRYALFMCDLDRFKDINDTNGHLTGDAVLRKIAEVLRAVFRREGDIVARYGGEEFICLVRNIDVSKAVKLAGAFRNAVKSLLSKEVKSDFAPYDESLNQKINAQRATPRDLTASIGVLCFDDLLWEQVLENKESLNRFFANQNVKDDFTFFCFLVDFTMYVAKQKRDTVVCANTHNASGSFVGEGDSRAILSVLLQKANLVWPKSPSYHLDEQSS